MPINDRSVNFKKNTKACKVYGSKILMQLILKGLWRRHIFVCKNSLEKREPSFEKIEGKPLETEFSEPF